MPSSRSRRRSNRNNSDQGNGSRKRSAQSKQPNRAAKKRKNNYKEAPAVEEQVEELFKVEKIVDTKLVNGVVLYKTRWKGYTAADDTWEPRDNVASTGHVDRWERQQRERTLERSTPGVAVIEYEDGERATVDMKIEKFRDYRDASDTERDDDSVNGDDDVNNFALLAEGDWIEILWRHTNMYFPCKIISWAPLATKPPSRKKKGLVLEDLVESSVSSLLDLSRGNKEQDAKGAAKVSKRGGRDLNQNKSQSESVQRGTSEEPLSNQKNGSIEPLHHELDNEMETREQPQHDLDDHSINSDSSGLSDDVDSFCDRPVERVGHGVPLFDEPEDDFGSSDDDCDEEEDDEEELNSYQCSSRIEGPKLSFEELWMLKLKRTQELIDRGCSGGTGVF